jgi:hypothetical protein
VGFDLPVNKKKNTLKQKQAKRSEQDAKIAEALAKHRLNQPERPKTKRAGSEELLRYILPEALSHAIRDPREFRSNTYNPERRLREFVDFLFVRYPVPAFLYRSVLTDEGWKTLTRDDRVLLPVLDWDRDVFLAAAQGRSVFELLKGKLSRKEAHWYLQAPGYATPELNVMWARLAAAGATPRDAQDIVWYLRNAVSAFDDRIVELGGFFNRYGPQMDADLMSDVLAYLRRAYPDPKFTLSGRTPESIRELCRLMRATTLTGQQKVPFRSWTPKFGFWQTTVEGVEVRMIELTNTRELAEEGRAQRHCVYTYRGVCEEAEVRILSFRWLNHDPVRGTRITKRLTVEVGVGNRGVVQAKGLANRNPSAEELGVLRAWMKNHFLALRLE